MMLGSLQESEDDEDVVVRGNWVERGGERQA